ncbi:hypothetical protein BJ742DRAFT_577329 [Cladochytrium replicatum]|nr:hypothetical protein BJ742DRAFT_577329 [Cladochytrium replicatum]
MSEPNSFVQTVHAAAVNSPVVVVVRSPELTFGDVLCMVIAFFIPPLGVFFKRGCDTDFCINLLLTLLGFLPGVIHAFYVIYVNRGNDEYESIA